MQLSNKVPTDLNFFSVKGQESGQIQESLECFMLKPMALTTQILKQLTFADASKDIGGFSCCKITMAKLNKFSVGKTFVEKKQHSSRMHTDCCSGLPTLTVVWGIFSLPWIPYPLDTLSPGYPTPGYPSP